MNDFTPKTYPTFQITGIDSDINAADVASIFTPVGFYHPTGIDNRNFGQGTLYIINEPTAQLLHKRLTSKIYWLRGSRLLIGPVHNETVTSTTLADEIDRNMPCPVFRFEDAIKDITDRIDELSGYGVSIKNVAPITTEEDLVRLFETKGKVLYSRAIRRGKGIKFAFVNFPTSEDALFAFRELNTYVLHGYELEVSPAFQGKTTVQAAAMSAVVTPEVVKAVGGLAVKQKGVTGNGKEEVTGPWSEEMGAWAVDPEDRVKEDVVCGDLLDFSE